ncbi:hypothetical protein BJ741DRAFT_662640 [Chytriomyces cf. hyalinus JEL632]|nr:hypothetical protein BJ741DRAFT_662640 [Chytriomyces cf. hyalinus JEL632]
MFALASKTLFAAASRRFGCVHSITATAQRSFSSLLGSAPVPMSFGSKLRAPQQTGVFTGMQTRGNAGTKKKKLTPVQLRNEVKVASKRKGKHYKMKNHRGALSSKDSLQLSLIQCPLFEICRKFLKLSKSWLIKSPRSARGPIFKRAQAGNSHLNRKNRAWKSRSKRARVTSNAQQNKLLRRLIPYHRKKYMR